MSELRRTIDQAAVAKQCALDDAAIRRLTEERDQLNAIADILPEGRARRDELTRQIAGMRQRVCDTRAAAAAEANLFELRDTAMSVAVEAYRTRVQDVADQIGALTRTVTQLLEDGKTIADTYGRWNGDRQEGVPEIVNLVCEPNEGLAAAFTQRRSLLVRWLDRVAARDKEFHGLEVAPPQKQAA